MSDSIEKSLLKSLYALADAVEARDPYTGGHLWRVSQFSRLVAQKMGLSRQDVALVALGGFLHDLGKIGIDDAVLRKPGRLTEQEYAQIKTHPQLGLNLVANHPLAHLVKDAIYSHHETPDGLGYPQGLGQDRIPLAAKIVGVTDAFDAMTSTRPYRAGMPLDKVLAILAENSGSQFDETVANVMIELGNNGELDHIIGHSDDGIPVCQCPMCGPTVVLKRGTQVDDVVFCRVCHNTMVVQSLENGISMAPTGNAVSAIDTVITPDIELIEALAAEVIAAFDQPMLGKMAS